MVTMEKTFTGKTLASDYLGHHYEEFTIKDWGYKYTESYFIPKYLPIVEPTNLSKLSSNAVGFLFLVDIFCAQISNPWLTPIAILDWCRLV